MENLEPDKVIGLRKIGEGGFGEVYKGNHKGKDIAIKVMRLDWTAIKEMIIQVKMNSPNIMKSTITRSIGCHMILASPRYTWAWNSVMEL